ncbi:MAG: hypothetical protein WC464_00195 [Bdellovibrionales bacterium]|jgi:hypothetical protein
MKLNEYLSQCDKNEERFQAEYDADMESLDEYINDAYAILEQAQSVLFFKRDIFSSCMDKADFDNLIIEKIKELL